MIFFWRRLAAPEYKLCWCPEWPKSFQRNHPDHFDSLQIIGWNLALVQSLNVRLNCKLTFRPPNLLFEKNTLPNRIYNYSSFHRDIIEMFVFFQWRSGKHNVIQSCSIGIIIYFAAVVVLCALFGPRCCPFILRLALFRCPWAHPRPVGPKRRVHPIGQLACLPGRKE